MFRSLKELEGFSAEGINGEAGLVRDFYFDDEAWEVRHVVVEYPGVAGAQQSLISPHSLTSIDRGLEAVYVMLTHQQIHEYCPGADSALPVVRQQALHRSGDPHLRSIRELERYRVQAANGSELGKICDVLVDDCTWHIDALAVSTQSGLTRIDPQQVSGLNCREKTVRIAPAIEPDYHDAPSANKERA